MKLSYILALHIMGILGNNVCAMDTTKEDLKKDIEIHNKTTVLAEHVETTKEGVQVHFNQTEQLLRNITLLQERIKQQRLDLARWCAGWGIIFLVSYYNLYKAIQREREKHNQKQQKYKEADQLPACEDVTHEA